MLSSKYLWGAVLLSVVTGCGPGDSDVGGDGSTGGSGTGTGGSSSGGSASGGSSSGGAASGGTTTGGTSSGGAGTGGSGGTSTPHKGGFVVFTQDKDGTLLRATFSNAIGGGEQACVKVGTDICYATTCDPAPDDAPVETNHPHAGTLTFTSADIAGSLSLGPNEVGDYGISTNTFEAPFSGGEQGLVTASGGDVPAFEKTIDVPLALLLTQPAYAKDGPQVIPRGSDLTLQWLRGTEGVTFNVQGSADRPDGMPGRARLQCNFPSEAGTGVIPSEVLQALPSGASVQVRTMRYVPVTAGEYEVTVGAGYGVYNEAKDQIVDPIVE